MQDYITDPYEKYYSHNPRYCEKCHFSTHVGLRPTERHTAYLGPIDVPKAKLERVFTLYNTCSNVGPRTLITIWGQSTSANNTVFLREISISIPSRTTRKKQIQPKQQCQVSFLIVLVDRNALWRPSDNLRKEQPPMRRLIGQMDDSITHNTI